MAAARGRESEKRRRRLDRLRCPTPVEPDLKPDEFAAKILDDIAVTVDDQARVFGAAWGRCLKVPIPYDRTNPWRSFPMSELLAPAVRAGSRSVAEEVRGVLAERASTQQAPSVVLLTGVSGVGKTKVAFDLGRDAAYMLLVRVCEKGIFCAPWSTYVGFAATVLNTLPENASAREVAEEKLSLVAVLVLLLASYLEWALDVSEEALRNEGKLRRAGGDVSRSRVLRLVAARCLRNGLGYNHVNVRFSRHLLSMLEDAVREDGMLSIPMEAARTVLEAQRARANRVWGDLEEPVVMWAHDEAQALLHVGGVPDDAFDGVWDVVAATLEASPGGGGGGAAGAGESEDSRSADAHPTTATTRRCGLLYGLLVAVRVVNHAMPSWHLLTGTNWYLTEELLNKHSPAQGCSESVSVTTSLSVDDMRRWLANLLTDEALEGATDERLARLRGRPLFLSYLWATLKEEVRQNGTAPPAELVGAALDRMWDGAVSAAKTRIVGLWDRHAPSARGVAPATLLRHLYHSAVMSGSVDVASSRWTDAVREAVTAGVLNVDASTKHIELEAEAATLEAILRVGHRHVEGGDDGVMEMLAERMTGPQGGDVADYRYGPAQEDCVSWYLVRRCLRVLPEPLQFEDLVRSLHVSSPSLRVPDRSTYYCLTPPAVGSLQFSLRRGHRCDGAEWEGRCPLTLLEEDPYLLLHHFRPSMAGPDIIFLARDREGRTRLVCLSLKNRRTGGLADAVRSVTVGNWFGAEQRGEESSGHKDMRRVLARHPEWFEAIRIVVGARPVSDLVLHDVALLNHHALADHPVFFFRPRREHLGVDIEPGDDGKDRASGDLAEYSRSSSSWPRALWPVEVAHWGEGVDGAAPPPLPRVPDAPDDGPVASLVVRVSGDASHAEIRAAVGCTGGDRSAWAEGIVDVVEHRSLTRRKAISVTFTRFADAMRLWEEVGAGRIAATHRPFIGRSSRVALAAMFAQRT
jgi:hypothetical protein